MNVVIVGAGPAGLFLAHQLLALSSSNTVWIYDRNQSPIDLEAFDGRGYGLGLGTRVQHWLNSIKGLKEQLTCEGLACEGIKLLPSDLILIPRRQLCALLLRSLFTQYGDRVADLRLSINFNASVAEVDFAHHQVRIEKESGFETIAYDLLVGADGIHSTIRSAMMTLSSDNIDFQQQQRPQVWKVLQLSMETRQHPPRIIQLQTRRADFGLIFGACLPQKENRFSALVFWQPAGSSDRMNPCGITTVEELQQLVQEMAPKHSSTLKLARDQAEEFLAAQPGREYWSRCRCYHDLAGQAVLIGDAAHGMFSLLGQGCTAAIADAVALSTLLQHHPEQWPIVLPQFSKAQVEEGHAASDLSLIALVLYDRWLGLLYKAATLLWVVILKQPSIFTRLNQVDANYVQVLHENRLWVWLAKSLFMHRNTSKV